ncbi:putative ABC transporter permease protein AmyD [Ktedonobacter sp. SOSP1-85]|nr:putative ABC transporter permease protein AmyD [Ktedonobacter sp. SOSP1-85]
MYHTASSSEELTVRFQAQLRLAKPRLLTQAHKGKKRKTWLVNLMYVPALILLAVFIFYPFLQGIRLSFTNWDGYSDEMQWVGWLQFRRILTDADILHTIVNTLIYGLGSTLLQNIFGLAYALFLDRKVRGQGIVRTIIYLPIIISPLIMGYIGYFFFQYDGGAVNDILKIFGNPPRDWLSNGTLAVWIITFVNSYQYVGIAMLIYLAGLQAIPKEYLEAAALDGASSFGRFKDVTLPLLMPSVTISIVYNIIGGLKLFDIIVALTQGGPGYASQSLSTMMYNLYFARQDAGYAATMGIVMFLLISIISIFSLRSLRGKEVQL